ncbi:MAG: hypothetical protein ACI4II_01985, partial [Acutalibacteraceae bacterium]
KFNFKCDIEVPLNISANDLVIAVNNAFDLNIDTSDINNCFLSTENPIALLRGNKELSMFNIRNGTVINYMD